MSDQTDGDHRPDLGFAGAFLHQAKPVLDNAMVALYGEDGAAGIRKNSRRQAEAEAEAEERVAEAEARHMRRSDFRERLETIQRCAITVTIVIACLLATLIGFEVWRILAEVTPS